MNDLAEGRAFDALTWRAASAPIWTCFDDSNAWVVFHPDSADIHLLTSEARTLWTVVASAPGRPFAELVRAFADALGRPCDDALTSATREALASMDRAGLIRPDRS